VTAQSPSKPARLTIAQLKALQATSNDPAGDSLVGPSEELRGIVDALVADTSVAGPMLLFFASNTALRQGQVEQAAFLFYAAQIRAAFDFDRYNVSSKPDGSNAATYLGFLKQTIGMSVNPAIMREPAQFAAVMTRLEQWEVVPAADAYYPEYERTPRIKLPRARWAARGRDIKEDFLTKFGRRTVRLLADPEYLEALRFIQDLNHGKVELSDANRTRMNASLATMAAAEARVFPEEAAAAGTIPDADAADAMPADPPQAPPVQPPTTAAAPPPAPVVAQAEDLPVRVGAEVPEPKRLTHVEPVFPAGSRGGVIVELQINPQGRVVEVHVLRGAPAEVDAVERAVRQWTYEPTRVNGRPVSVLLPVSLSPR
jgi:TonB family protein